MAITNFHEKTKVIPKRLATKQIAQVNKQANPKLSANNVKINAITTPIIKLLYIF